MYPISAISDILRQRVDSLAPWLEHWISTGDPGSNPMRGVRIFQTMHHLSFTRFIFVR